MFKTFAIAKRLAGPAGQFTDPPSGSSCRLATFADCAGFKFLSRCLRHPVTAMTPTTASPRGVPFTDGQKAALLTLLADEDPGVYHAIRGEILAHDSEAGEWLRGYSLSNDPVVRRRSREIVTHFDRQAADNDFIGFCLRNGEDLDLEMGALLLARTRYPHVNTAAYRALLDSYADELADRVIFRETVQGILDEVNRLLFRELGYTGNEEDYYDPANSYLNCVMDRRTGNPITLCSLYVFVSRRLHLPVAGVGMPGHFLCRFQNSREEYYINPFYQGRLITKAECIKHLKQNGHDYHEHFLAPLSPRKTLLRMCSNLHHIYASMELPEERLRVQRYIKALDR
jgi:regulator of sirC expression with transglutaminase-like and TPR domain